MAAMLSLTPPKPSASPFSTRLNPPRSPHLRRALRISAAKLPPPPPPASPGQVYQPFRPPPSPLPAKYRSLSPVERLDVLRDRLGLWYEYAPLISSLLSQAGFTPPSIEETTGISGVEQNHLIVAAQVRDSLLTQPPELLSFFDSPGSADLLYELRLLSASQRAAAARRVVERGLSPKEAKELARAIRDFPRRRGEDAWAHFDATAPGDCLAYTLFRLSREAIAVPDRISALDKAMEEADTDAARARIAAEIERANKGSSAADDEDEDDEPSAAVTVVRLRYGEVADATTVRLLPVCKAAEGEVGLAAVPVRCRAEGEMGVVVAEKGWGRWVVLPGWRVVGAAEAGVAVEFADARELPWRVNRWGKEETVLVVADRAKRAVAEEKGFYLVGNGQTGRLAVERGGKLAERGVKEALATVVLVVRPPKEEEEEQLSDEEWV